MKIHQIPHGTRFEYEGETYVKSGPLSGAGKAGPRLIPRYAVLTPLDAVVSAPAVKPKDALDRATVLGVFETFCATCHTLVPEDKQPALTAAREQFLKTIE